jgi:hypothetical protein
VDEGLNVYKTEAGMIFRVSESQEGHISVETLDDATWVAGRIGMVGLRVLPTTVRLTARQVLALPV